MAAVRQGLLSDKHGQYSRLDRLKAGTVLISVDPAYFRPTEVETLLGDPTKARQMLNWRTECSFDQLVSEMVLNDLDEAARDALSLKGGFPTPNSFEERM